MATSFQTLRQFMDASGLSFNADDEAGIIGVGFRCEAEETTYRDEDGDPCVQLFLQLHEDGEFLSVCAPHGWNLAECEHVPVVCEALARIQAQMKLIRFDLSDDGMLRPNIEIPLEKAPLCVEQLQRGIAGVLLAIRRYDAVIRHAMDTGLVDLELARDDEPTAEDAATPDAPPAPDMGRILDLADEAGGLDALDRLLGGDGAPPVEA